MPIRVYKPTSPGRRAMSVSTFDEITRSRPERSLVAKKNSRAGRNNEGHITARHRGGGVKRRYRIIDFKRNKYGVPAKVFSVEYDPNRSARIALLHYVDGEKRYILAPNGLNVGDRVMSGPEADIRVGNALPLRNIPTGTVIHNIELHKGRGGQIVRSAGTAAQLMAKEGDYAVVRLDVLFGPAVREREPVDVGLNANGCDSRVLRLLLFDIARQQLRQHTGHVGRIALLEWRRETGPDARRERPALPMRTFS